MFADVLPDQNIDPAAVEAAVTPRTRAIMPVHLTGRMADMNPLMAIADKHGLAVIEDSAQAVGSTYDGRMSGTIGTFGCFSAHPLKNLNAAGDAGFVVTADAELADEHSPPAQSRPDQPQRRPRNGASCRGSTRSRPRCFAFACVTCPRSSNAGAATPRNTATSSPASPLFIPPCRNIEFNTFHTFVVQTDRRDELQKYLAGKGIETAIHYPVPIHLQAAAAHLGHGAARSR